MKPPTAAVILAAGAASRMGRPKQLLPFRGRSFLRHAAEVAVAADLDPIVVVLGAYAEKLEAELDGLPIQIVRNAAWARGMGTSIRAGIRALDDRIDAVLLLLCDQPFIEPALLRKYLAARQVARCEVVASAYADTLGVPALFGRSWFPRLLALEDGAGAKKLLTTADKEVRVVPFPEGEVDIDTLADYERLWATEATGLADNLPA